MKKFKAYVWVILMCIPVKIVANRYYREEFNAMEASSHTFKEAYEAGVNFGVSERNTIRNYLRFDFPRMWKITAWLLN